MRNVWRLLITPFVASLGLVCGHQVATNPLCAYPSQCELAIRQSIKNEDVFAKNGQLWNQLLCSKFKELSNEQQKTDFCLDLQVLGLITGIPIHPNGFCDSIKSFRYKNVFVITM